MLLSAGVLAPFVGIIELDTVIVSANEALNANCQEPTKYRQQSKEAQGRQAQKGL
jgi:hypothetical protein